MQTKEQGFTENGIAYLTTDGEWRIGTNIADLSEIRQYVFAKLLQRAYSDVKGYFTDFYHDAMWCQNVISGTDPITFWYVYDDMGTHTGQGEPTVARFREKGVRVTVRWEDTGRGRGNAWLKFETIHRRGDWRK